MTLPPTALVAGAPDPVADGPGPVRRGRRPFTASLPHIVLSHLLVLTFRIRHLPSGVTPLPRRKNPDVPLSRGPVPVGPAPRPVAVPADH
ncbi:hypothetical protein [Streptomyces sp. HUAS TT7]|uniref:hypothetical protein n=1 Tax=Streptomyces sp. HUAS TT7 TaxID=3447507 RepID=UPI003F65EFA7